MRVLLVEDEPPLRSLLAMCLQQDFDCTVVEARHGAEALKALEKDSSFDLLITDVHMPYIDGQTLGRAVHEVFPAIPILYISGYVTGATDGEFLAKPFSRDEFVMKVREMVAAAGAAWRGLV